MILFYFFLKRKRRDKDAELSGGFACYAGLDMKEKELLRILVMEELERCKISGQVPKAKKSRAKRLIFTAVYIALNFVLLINCYYRAKVGLWLTVPALIYVFLMHRCDPVGEICKAIKAQPSRDISQIVWEMTTDRHPKSRKTVGLVAFALTIGFFLIGAKQEQFRFTAVPEGYCLSSYRPDIFFSGNVQIPDTYQGSPVTAIGDSAFENVAGLTRVQIPETVTKIGSYAFKNCRQLKDIALPSGLTTLNGESFKGCSSLMEILIPAGVTEIRGNTFENCTSLHTVQLHDKIVDIHAYAFSGCKKLKNITLPAKIKEVHTYTFANCTSLQQIEIPKGVTRIAARAFYHCTALCYVYIPDSVQQIRSSAFRECESLQQIELPNGVQIDERAFKDSPTQLLKKRFTDGQTDRILKEVQEKEPQILYYIYKRDNPDEVMPWHTGWIVIADDVKYKKRLDSTMAMGEMNGYGQVQQYLEKAKQAGIHDCYYLSYSDIGTQILGEDFYTESELRIDDMIEICKQNIAEDDHG